MSRKHFVAIAKLLETNYRAAACADRHAPLGTHVSHRAIVQQIAYDICRYAKTEHPRFVESKFLEAALPINV